MPNNYMSVLYKHIIQVKNKNVGLKVGGHKHTIAPPSKKVGGGRGQTFVGGGGGGGARGRHRNYFFLIKFIVHNQVKWWGQWGDHGIDGFVVNTGRDFKMFLNWLTNVSLFL